MFGFRSNHTRRKVHSNHQRPTQSTDVRPNVEISRLRVEQAGPSFDEKADDVRYYEENSSVDMSLYTTQSKSTIHYSSRALINYGNFENESDDGYSCAQTEFTTEIALNRYFRLGGASWQHNDPLHVTPKPYAGSPVSPDCQFTSPQSKQTEQTKESTVSSWSRNSTVSDDDSLNVISPTDSDCEQTTCSLLPATSKMARLANMSSPAILQQAQERLKTPLVHNTYSTEARDHCEIENVAPNALPISTSKNRQSVYKGPIDLDESVADSVSMTSSSNSCVVSFSGTAPPRIYRQAGNRLLAQQVSFSPSHRGSRHRESPLKNSKDDEDTCLFSSGDSSSATSSKLSLHYGTSTPPQKTIEPVSVPMSISSGSWRGRSLLSPDQFSDNSLRDDDTYGFSIVSADCDKSVTTYKSGDMTPKVRLGELFEQWSDSYESTSAKWKPQRTSRQGPPCRDMSLDTLYSNAIAGGSRFEDHKSSNAPCNSTTAKQQSLDTSRVSPHCNVPYRRPSTSSESNERIIAKLSTAITHTQGELKDRSSPRTGERPQRSAIAIEKDPATRGMAPFSLSSYTGKTVDRQAGNAAAAVRNDVYLAQQNNGSYHTAVTERKVEVPSSASPNCQVLPSKASKETYKSASRRPSQGAESGNKRSDASGLTTLTFLANDDDTFGFSTTSPAPIPELSNIQTLGIRPSPLTRTGGGTGGSYAWADRKFGHEINDARLNMERRPHNSKSHPTRTRDQAANVTGTLFLTETELQKHLTKVQEKEPHPSTSVEGYDSWKQKQEEKERYFAMLDAKAKQEKPSQHTAIDRRQPGNVERTSPRVERRQQTTRLTPSPDNKCVDRTMSAMNHSIDIAIPTLRVRRSTPRSRKGKTGRRPVWGWLQSGRKSKAQEVNAKQDHSHSKEKQTMKKRHKGTEQEIVSLSHFMRISGEDDSEVIEFSTSPLHKDGILSLGTTTLPDSANTDAATKSHYLQDKELGTRGLVSQFIQEEREKQHLAELEKRKLSNENNPKVKVLSQPNKNIRYQERSIRSASPVESNQVRQFKPPLKKSRDERSVVVQTVSVSSKQSVDSSMRSGSAKILSPCVVCTSAERTHIAMPCMHFYFCKECVETLYKAKCPKCPVCSTTDVVFTRVYTG